MNRFEVGDTVVANPYVENLPPNTNRPWNVGTITAINNNYAHVSRPGRAGVHRIRYTPMNNFPGYKALTHYSQSNKGLRSAHRNKFANTLKNIPKAREGMEARSIWNSRVNLPFKNGPGRNFLKFLDSPNVVDPEKHTSRAFENTRKSRSKARSRKAKAMSRKSRK